MLRDTIYIEYCTKYYQCMCTIHNYVYTTTHYYLWTSRKHIIIVDFENGPFTACDWRRMKVEAAVG